MDGPPGFVDRLTHRFFGFLLNLYPKGFSRDFSGEVETVLMARLREAAEGSSWNWLSGVWCELKGLTISIVTERWREWSRRWTGVVAMETGTGGGGMQAGAQAGLRSPNAPWPVWVSGWTLLVTVALPAAWFIMAPIAALYLWLLGVGSGLGLWAMPDSALIRVLALGTSLAFCLGAVQTVLLRRVVPRPALWFASTAGGLLLAVVAVVTVVFILPDQPQNPFINMAGLLLGVGLILGLAQWLCLRRWSKHAGWVVAVDALAFGSFLLSGGTITSLAELTALLILPGAISGVGLWILASRTAVEPHRGLPQSIDRKIALRRRVAILGLGALALVPLFFFGIWAYAASQLALAKRDGIYPTATEAVIAHNSQGWGEAQVVGISNVHASPNSSTRQPHVWFGGATVYLDRIPEGGRRDSYVSGSFYIHVRGGWVYVPEGAFPEFIGWVMEFYGMEGVGETAGG